MVALPTSPVTAFVEAKRNAADAAYPRLLQQRRGDVHVDPVRARRVLDRRQHPRDRGQVDDDVGARARGLGDHRGIAQVPEDGAETVAVLPAGEWPFVRHRDVGAVIKQRRTTRRPMKPDPPVTSTRGGLTALMDAPFT